jgi:hypothetical protein
MLALGLILGLPPGSPGLRLLLILIMMVVSSSLSADLSYVRGFLSQTGALVTGAVSGLLIRRRIGVW